MQTFCPKVTIITSIRNIIKSGRQEMLKQTIESVQSQTYSNIEHIIQDGASDDGTLNFLQEYKDKGWITVYSEKDTSVHDAINKAATKASGDYIALLSSDDYYKDNDIIEYIVNNYLKDGKYDYCYGDEERISASDNKYIWTWHGDLYKDIFWRGVFCPTEALIMSKKMFDEIGGFDTKYPVVADVKLQMKIILGDYKGINCNRVIDVFREGGGLSSDPDIHFFHTNEAIEICYEFWKNFDDDLTPEKVEHMIKYEAFSETFFMKLRRYIIHKKLKNFDYIKFNKHIESMIAYYKEKTKNKMQTTNKFQLFNKFTIAKTIKNDSKKEIFIFGIPILTVTKKKGI